MTHARLQTAYEALMQRAPSPLFQKARALYLCKYCLDGRDSTSALRLFIAKERVDEAIVPGVNDGERLAVVSIRPECLALVHWQQAGPPSLEQASNYFQTQWGMELPDLTPIRSHGFEWGDTRASSHLPETCSGCAVHPCRILPKARRTPEANALESPSHCSQTAKER